MPCRVIAEVLIDLFSGELQLFIDWDSLHSHGKPENVNNWRESFLSKMKVCGSSQIWSRWTIGFHPHQDVSSDLEGQTNKPTSSTNIVGVSILLHKGHAHNPTPRPKNKWAACICKDKNSTIFGGTKMLTKSVCVRERERERERTFDSSSCENCGHPIWAPLTREWILSPMERDPMQSPICGGAMHHMTCGLPSRLCTPAKKHTQTEKKMHDCISQGIWYCAISLISLFLSSTP